MVWRETGLLLPSQFPLQGPKTESKHLNSSLSRNLSNHASISLLYTIIAFLTQQSQKNEFYTPYKILESNVCLFRQEFLAW